MAGGVKFYPDIAELQFFAIGDGLRAAGEIIAVAQPHHVERLLRGKHRAMTRPGVVGMAVRDHGPLHGPHRVDVEAAGLAAQAGRSWQQDVLRAHVRYIVPPELRSSLLLPSSREAVGRGRGWGS